MCLPEAFLKVLCFYYSSFGWLINMLLYIHNVMFFDNSFSHKKKFNKHFSYDEIFGSNVQILGVCKIS